MIFMELLREQQEIGEAKFRDRTIAYSDGDVIVPDVKPDILKILQVDAMSAINSKEVSDGLIKVSGIIKYNILYIPDKEGESIKSISTQMNFSHSIDKKKLPESAVLDICSEVERVDFTLLNSRKLNIKTAVCVEYKVWENKEITVSAGIDYEGAQTIYRTVNTQSPEIMEEYAFSVRDRLEIPSGRAPIAEVLKMDITVCDREVKAITGKAVAKGNVRVCALYIDTEGNINSVDGEIPFTEIAEIFELEEDAACSVQYRLSDYAFEVGTDEDGDARHVDFDISLLAVINSSQNREIRLIEDCFCPGCRTDMVYDRQEFEEIVMTASGQYTVKEAAAPDKKLPQIASVYNVIARPCITKAVPQNGKVVIEGRMELYILYITDNAQMPIYSIKKDVPLEFAVEAEKAEEGLDCTADVRAEHTSFNLNMAQEAEVRCILSAEVKLSRRVSVDMVSDCTLSDKPHECGIVIYFVQPGDTLWKIAKRYCVSVGDIVKYNNIQDENVINVGQKLIIPFC